MIISTSDTFYKIGHALENKAARLLNNGLIEQAREARSNAAWALSSAAWLESDNR
jgi:hypothetical protein